MLALYMNNYQCLKCNTQLQQSENSKSFGIESYRCENCHTLFSVNDFKKGQLISPKFQYQKFNDYFEELSNKGSVMFPMGMGRSKFIEEIARTNDIMLIINSENFKHNFENIKNIKTCTQLINNNSLLQDCPIVIIDEVHFSFFDRIYDLIKENKSVYIINPPHPYHKQLRLI